jgi:hypothetical protein
MNENRNKLKETYYSYLENNLSLKDFETFIYEHAWIAEIIGENKYLDLICLDFKNSAIKYQLGDIFIPVFGLGEYYKRTLLKDFHEALLQNENLPSILAHLYDLYCDGYDFLQDLGLGYGLSCVCPSIGKKVYNSWEELNDEQKKRILNSFLPQLPHDIKRVIDWLERDTIILLDEKDNMDRMTFADNRNEEEKKSTVWVLVSENQATGAKVYKSIIKTE